MTSTVQPITQSMIPVRYSMAAVQKVASTNVVHSLSKDRNWLFASDSTTNKNVLRMSNDDGTSWSDIHTFNAGGNGTEIVAGVIEMADGEVCVATSASIAAVPAFIYKSSGWGTTLAQHQAATWTNVFITRGGSPVDVWGFNQKGVGTNGVAVFSVYNGGQTNSGSNDAAQATRPRYVYMTQDHGATWAQIYDIYTMSGVATPGGVHIHSCVYHEAWDRVWVMFGDSSGAGQAVAGAGNCMIIYSDDRGASWTALPIPQFLVNVVCQFTSIVVTANALIVGHDQQNPGFIVTFPITGFKTFGNARINPIPQFGSPYGKSLYRAAPGLPLIAGFGIDATNGSGTAQYPELLCSPDDSTWYPLWRDPAPVSKLSGFFAAVTGPSLRGKIVAVYESGYLVGTLVGPA